MQHVAVKRSRSAPDGPLTIGRHSFYRPARAAIAEFFCVYGLFRRRNTF